MIKEDKVKLMTKLAIYEQGEGKKDIPTSKYYRSDYMSVKMIESFIATTIVYILIVVIGVLFNIDYLSENIVSLDLVALGKEIAIGYAVILIVLMIISYVVYSIKYKKIKKSLESYGEDLKTLYLMYKKEEMQAKRKEEVKAGGNSDDATIGF
ncbi:MAG: hypothetical protein E7270_08960 [Lachnospiraceae bacterium]|nr:hypothetical protein [Lachnospiraceae bacterium]MBQ4068101.1 hypothetical protein [Lachnospiraceae bacterium]